MTMPNKEWLGQKKKEPSKEDLELRREALEASGWHWVRDDNPDPDDKDKRTWPLKQLRDPSFPKSPCRGDENMHFRPGGNQTWASWDVHTRPIESEPAFSEPWFLAWCERNNCEWNISTCARHDGHLEKHIVVWVFNETIDAEASGKTPSEARARAVIEASKINFASS